MTRTHRTILTAILVAGLLSGVGFAQMRGGFGYGVHGGAATMLRAPAAAAGWAGMPRIAGLPVGSTVEVRLYDQEPADGVAARATFSLNVGVDSEAAFAEAVAEARAAAAEWDAAYLVVTVSEVSRTIALSTDDAAAPRGARTLALRLPLVGMQAGDTVTVTLYDGDPADGGAPLETLSFAYGVDSAIGFRAALDAALDTATHARVTTSPRTATFELPASAVGAADRDARRSAMLERLEARDGRGVRGMPWGRGLPARR